MGDYDIDIEIDADTGDIIWEHNGKQYFYTVEELEGKEQILNLLPVADTQITVYSQTETMTKKNIWNIWGYKI